MPSNQKQDLLSDNIITAVGIDTIKNLTPEFQKRFEIRILTLINFYHGDLVKITPEIILNEYNRLLEPNAGPDLVSNPIVDVFDV